MAFSSQEVKFALRTMRKRPAFSIITVLVLALGIGANTAIFSVVNSVLLQPLPFPEPNRLVQLWHTPPEKSFPGLKKFSLSPANYLDWKAQNTTFESMAIYGQGVATLTGSGEPQSVPGTRVSPEFFSTLGVKPMMGRTFTTEDGSENAGKTVVISEDFWRTNFGGNSNILGQTIRLNDEPHTVIGIMKGTFSFPAWNPAPKMWTCMQWDPKERAVRGNHNYMAFGRLKPGVSVQQAQSELSTIAARLAKEYPADDTGWGAMVLPLREELVGDVRPALLVLLGAVGFVLLIACANVANLVLAATLARGKELAIRTALGASRSDLIRGVLIETVILALAGGAVGLLFAHFGVQVILNFLSNDLPRMGEIGLDSTVLVFTFAVSLLTGLLSGLVPALKFAKADINEALKQGVGRGSTETGGRRTRTTLVIAEVALSLMLLVGAGLMIRTFYHLQKTESGVDPHNVLTTYLPLPKAKYDKGAPARNFYSQVLTKVRALPGVESAAVVDSLPLQGGSVQPIMIEGRPLLQMSDQPEVPTRNISAGYLKTMHIPVIRGRDFSESDTEKSTPVALISQSLAKEFFPNEDPIGKHISMELTDKYMELPTTPREIVGVVGDVKMEGLDSDRSDSAIYLLHDQVATGHMGLAVRTAGDPMNVATAVANAVHAVDPTQTLLDTMSMEDVIAASLAQRRFTMMLLVTFAGLALLLAGVGIYSVLSYAVRRRVREIGIRMALGAQVKDVVAMIVADGMKPALAGVAIGFVGALLLGRVMASVIYGVSARDSLTFASVSLVLLTVAFLASAVPAYRAAQVEPVRTLRDE
ncbi:MAG TPA: ABC transporter permease [Terriglobales bacterium]|nr:ABC transporter permease [Terriglobales bacterium]